ncbi:formylglycine-generating enzyme family protein [Crocinitomix algicola]|uniref:formylglycine-generating enzyme family protein n=1 Tax=Crocinitomix algicola TaxID=1740263 RepID=UPI000871E37D|nr:SUMF1/EgtB/PvdO family nonheme iron enzyme [Crocinitomix algicola]
MKQFLIFIYFAFFICVTGLSQAVANQKHIEKLTKKFLKEFTEYVWIPGGTLQLAQDDSLTSTINPFFMFNHEVTNLEYQEFLYFHQSKDPEKYTQLLLDTTVWRGKNENVNPLENLYHKHPAYHNYPVVGVSFQQANLFCEWLTQLYNDNPNRIFKKVKYRLPTEREWIYAANGGNETATYPWAGPYIRNASGDFLANCLKIGSENTYRDTVYYKTEDGQFIPKLVYITSPFANDGTAGFTNDHADYTSPSKSYWPNNFGLYNMAGNVSEMVAEEGITHGGSYIDPAFYLKNSVRQTYKSAHSTSANRGFRFVMEVVEY